MNYYKKFELNGHLQGNYNAFLNNPFELYFILEKITNKWNTIKSNEIFIPILLGDSLFIKKRENFILNELKSYSNGGIVPFSKLEPLLKCVSFFFEREEIFINLFTSNRDSAERSSINIEEQTVFENITINVKHSNVLEEQRKIKQNFLNSLSLNDSEWDNVLSNLKRYFKLFSLLHALSIFPNNITNKKMSKQNFLEKTFYFHENFGFLLGKETLLVKSSDQLKISKNYFEDFDENENEIFELIHNNHDMSYKLKKLILSNKKNYFNDILEENVFNTIVYFIRYSETKTIIKSDGVYFDKIRSLSKKLIEGLEND